MVDINNISSNLLLVGLVIVGLCCLYLLYSNFVKSREINELKQKVEDVKTIFFNQQQHNDQEYSKMINMVSSYGMGTVPGPSVLTQRNLDTHSNNSSGANTPTKLVNIDPSMTNADMFQSAGGMTGINVEMDNDENNKEITLDLHELDNMDAPKDGDNLQIDNLDDIDNLDVEEEDVDDNLDDEEEIEDNVFDSVHSIKHDDNIENIDNIQIEILDDNASISTDPMITDLELNDIMNEDLDIDNEECGDCCETPEQGHSENDNDNCEDDNIGDLDLDNLDELDLDATTKQITITELESETQTTTTVTEPNTKTINLDNTSPVINETESIELDKLLSGGNENIKKVEIDQTTNNTDLSSMSIKQLKELAKTHKLKATGSKQELINLLSTVITQ